MRTPIRLHPRLLLAAWCWFFATSALAHDPGLSALNVRVETSCFVADLTLARGDVEALVWMDTNMDGRISAAEFDSVRGKLETQGLGALDLQLDGRELEVTNVSVQLDPSDAVHFFATFPRGEGRQLRVHSEILASLPRGHKQYLSVRSGPGLLLGEQMLDASTPALEIKLNAPAPSSSFFEFVSLGVEHIVTGYDHLVFLLGLLIVGAGFRDIVKIITSFTLAHSITLALATLDLIRLSPRVVEPMIAASIVYVGIENIVSHHLQRRWMLAFAFGLIHGCGFASALRERGIGVSSSVVIPLVSFNLGVELGQVTLAAIALPLIWKWKKSPRYASRFVPGCSVLIALAGVYWLAQRLFFS